MHRPLFSRPPGKQVVPMTNHREFPISFYRVMLLIASSAALFAADAAEELGPPRDVAFTSSLDGTEQRYVIRLPPGFDARRHYDLMVALHGHGSDRWQFCNDARDECRAARDSACVDRMIYVSPDYRAKTSWMGPAAVSDMLQMLDDLHGTYRIDNVIISGASMGGTAALAFAALHPEQIDGVVSMNGTANLIEYTQFADAISASFGGSKSEKPDEYRIRSAELFPERLRMPLGMTTGGHDTVVPSESTLRLAKALEQQGSPSRLIHRSEGGHATTYVDATTAFRFVLDKTYAARPPCRSMLTFESEPRTIVCIGDSVTGVYYHTGGKRAYPEMLELGLRALFPKARITVINAGISGHTTQEGLNRLDSDVLSKNPDLVTISFGLNDLVRNTPEVFRANLESLVTRCRERGSQIVLCTPNAVIDTTGRPIDTLVSYCEIIRDVGERMSVRVCDQYRAGTRLKTRAPLTWRLTLSDEIHPNMDGHKRMAEELCDTISGKTISLENVPPSSSLSHVKELLLKRTTVKVLAMPPYDSLIVEAFKRLDETAEVDVTTWSVDGKSIATIEQEAKDLVRKLKPDLVVIAVPRDADSETNEKFIHGYSWIMNWSLSFGLQEWDCIVVHPSVTASEIKGARDDLCRKLVWAQHLELIDRGPHDKSETASLFIEWFAKRRP